MATEVQKFASADERNRFIVDQMDAGMSGSVVAKLVGLSRTWVHEIYKDEKSGRKKRSPGRPPSRAKTTTWIGRLGQGVRRVRLAKGLTLEEVVERCPKGSGLTYYYLSLFERGKRPITMGRLLAICQALDVPVAEVWPRGTLPGRRRFLLEASPEECEALADKLGVSVEELLKGSGGQHA